MTSDISLADEKCQQMHIEYIDETRDKQCITTSAPEITPAETSYCHTNSVQYGRAFSRSSYDILEECSTGTHQSTHAFELFQWFMNLLSKIESRFFVPSTFFAVVAVFVLVRLLPSILRSVWLADSSFEVLLPSAHTFLEASCIVCYENSNNQAIKCVRQSDDDAMYFVIFIFRLFPLFNNLLCNPFDLKLCVPWQSTKLGFNFNFVFFISFWLHMLWTLLFECFLTFNQHTCDENALWQKVCNFHYSIAL